MTDPLITPLTSSPLWQLLRLRLAPPAERALVFLSHGGADAVVPPREGDYWGYPRPTARAVRQGEFYDVVWVSLARRQVPVDIPLRSADSPARYRVAWKVRNPVEAARHGITEEQARRLVVEHIGANAALPGAADPLRRPPVPFGTAEVEPPGRPRVIEGVGLTYWFLDPPAGLLPTPGADAGPTLPAGFGEPHREAYRFYREVVAGGPVGLAALWLLHHPDQARDVLDWTVTHRDLLSHQDDWERALAATLQSLTPADRGYVGVSLAHILSEVGVPQGEEVLRRIDHAGPSENGTDPYGDRR
jgi:hypothetical protein